MRFPIYSKGSNPCVDAPLMRKGTGYIASLLERGQAVWIDEAKPEMGMLLLSKFTAHSSEVDREKFIAAGNMRDAWGQVQSGYAGPLVLQMPRSPRLATA